MLAKSKKQALIKKHKTHGQDTGSPEVQVALLSEKIKDLTRHLGEHRKDASSRRGLLQMVNKRRKLLNYLEKEDEKRHKKLLKSLGLKHKESQE
ncbi:MAG: 30S ribosomal protein S15 [Candidatus Andersenbacteria bacterium]